LFPLKEEERKGGRESKENRGRTERERKQWPRCLPPVKGRDEVEVKAERNHRKSMTKKKKNMEPGENRNN